MGKLANLAHLDLTNNRIQFLPTEARSLSSLTTLKVDKNPLVSPPREIMKQGTRGICRYLQRIHHGNTSGRLDLSELGLHTFPATLHPTP